MLKYNPSFLILAIFLFLFLVSCGTHFSPPLSARNATETAVAPTNDEATIRAVVSDVNASGILTAQAFANSYLATATAAASLPTRTPAPTRAAAVNPTAAGSPLPTIVIATLPMSTLTPRPSPTATLSGAAILSFTVVPTTTQRLGDKLSVQWQTTGDQSALCAYTLTPQGPVERPNECSDVSSQGSKTLTITENDLAWSGLLLRTTRGKDTARGLAPLTLGCHGLRDWFFTPSPPTCPQAPAITTSAAAQPFEHGLMLWLKQPDAFYVFFDSDKPSGMFQFVSAPYNFTPGASPDNRVSETPPAGMFEPVSGFGQIWRGEIVGMDNLRARLGWATAPEAPFETSSQCELANSAFNLWSCFLRRPDGKVLHLHPDSTAQVHFLWEVW